MEAVVEQAWQAGAQAEAEAAGHVGASLVEERIFIYHADEAIWHLGTVTAYDPPLEVHSVRVDFSGETSAVKLGETRWVLAAAGREESYYINLPPELATQPPPAPPPAARSGKRRQPVRRAAAAASSAAARTSAAEEAEEPRAMRGRRRAGVPIRADDPPVDENQLLAEECTEESDVGGERKGAKRQRRKTAPLAPLAAPPTVDGVVADGVVADGAVADGAVADGAAPPSATAADTVRAVEWEEAGEDLPGWKVERRYTALSGRSYIKYYGPDGQRASSRAHALAGGKAATVRSVRGRPKLLSEMTISELIHERTQGIPTAAAKQMIARRRQRSAAGAEEGAMAPPTAAAARRGGARPFETEEERVAREDAEVVAYGAPLEPEEGDGGGAAEAAEAAGGGYAPQMRLVDGQIVFDESSVQVAAPKANAWERAHGYVEEDSGRGTTSSSYLNRAPSTPWGRGETPPTPTYPPLPPP